ncbi:MAG: transglycosylase domain-containing protein [Desulforhopalus sp.]
MLKKLFFLITAISFLGLLGGAIGLYWFVVVDPGEEIKEENIDKILSRESHVYYSDGITKLGVFFDTAHRQYVSYEEIPQDFVNALVASEDNSFFTHFGFDPVGIARAMIKNIQAGRIVQGGSTLTQQTAKNLFERTERSYRAKFKELGLALRLEYHYSKEKIFEFYANQFYVSGNGHGLGVAARYYFDKKPEELTLTECAFIAGSVKRPNYYNPFIKKSEEEVEKALARAKIRMRYVLEKMFELGMIDTARYNDALANDLQFNKGKVGFDLDYGMDLVREAVSSTEVQEALEEHGVGNIATAGVRVITSLDRTVQRKTLAILRRELSTLDVRLSGYEREDVQQELTALEYDGDSQLQVDSFLFGTIETITSKSGEVRIVVMLDKKLGRGVIDNSGLERLVDAWVKFTKNRWSKTGKGDLEKFVARLKPGDRVWVRVVEISDEDPPLLSLEKYPQVQGGALILREGTILGMAGGTENRFFNRAVHAKRTMGSSFKPLVYTAALQLGWNSLDLLRNSRDLFVFHGQPYFPRPDHKSPFEWVSMNWAGVLSENVASVWLVAHLCDQLTPTEFKDVARYLGFTPRIVDGQEESYRSYKTRIRDRYGIVVNEDALKTAAYRMAVNTLETDFIFDNMMDEYQLVKKLPYGLDYDRFRKQLREELQQNRGSLSQYESAELWLRISLLNNSYLLLETLRNELRSYRARLDTIPLSPYGSVNAEPFMGKASLYKNLSTGEYHFLPLNAEKNNYTLVDPGELRQKLYWAEYGESRGFWDKIKLNGTLTVAAFDKVTGQVDHEYGKLKNQLSYSFDVLANVEDFRITVGLHYIIELAKELGIRSGLEPVLSFPLGSNVVSLLEATRMYEALVTGKIEIVNGDQQEESKDALAILDRIETEEGTVLYQRQPVFEEIVDDKSRISICNILENVVKFGTGKSGDKKVRLGAVDTNDDESDSADLNLPVPFLGKTGTANRYTNASFFGYLPGVADNGAALTLADGYAIGVYVGYDNNMPMRHKASRISGALGALPAWTEIANVLLDVDRYGDRLDPVDLSFYGLGIKKRAIGQVNVEVDPERGGKVTEPVKQVSEIDRYDPSVMSFGRTTESGRFVAERNYMPFWKNSRAD